MALDPGVRDSEKRVNNYLAEEIGSCIQKSLDGQAFSNCKLKRKDQLSSLKILYSTIQINTKM